MSDHRAYYVQLAGSKELDCDTDLKAIESARKMLDGQDIEIWDGLRKIVRLQHKPE